jgi:hypothetical protein
MQLSLQTVQRRQDFGRYSNCPWLRHNEALGEYSDYLLLLNLRRLTTINGDLVDEDFGLLEYTSSSPWLFWLFALVKAHIRVWGHETNLTLTLTLLCYTYFIQINQYERMEVDHPMK